MKIILGTAYTVDGLTRTPFDIVNGFAGKVVRYRENTGCIEYAATYAAFEAWASGQTSIFAKEQTR